MKGLYEFYFDSYYGELSGLFVASNKDVDSIIGKTIYFGEVLGKHSEVEITLDKTNIYLLSKDQHSIAWLKGVTGGSNTISGYNPLDYIDDYEYEEEED